LEDLVVEIKLANNSQPGEFILLDNPPFAVNVQILHAPNNLVSIVASVPNIIPLSQLRQLDKIKIGSKLHLSYYPFPYELAFSSTYHKVQGKTLSNIILDLNHNTTKTLTIHSLYVLGCRELGVQMISESYRLFKKITNLISFHCNTVRIL